MLIASVPVPVVFDHMLNKIKQKYGIHDATKK
jgi:hypothetical protein